MAFLAPLAAGAGTVGATAGAAALAKGAALAGGSSLATGLAAGTALGAKASLAAMPALSYAGANVALPALASKGLAAATPGIFSAAAPALGGLQSLAGPGLLNTMGMSPLAGLAGTTSMVPTATGLSSLYSTVPALTTSPAASGLLNTLGMSPLGGAQAIIPNATVAGQTAALEAAKGSIIGSGAQAQTNLARQLAMDAAKQQAVGSGTQSLINTANTNASVIDAINRNVAGGAAQGSPGIASAPAPYTPASPIVKGQNFLQNAGNFFKDPSVDAAIDYAKEHPMATAGLGLGAYQLLKPKEKAPSKDVALIRPYTFDYNPNAEAYAVSPTTDSSERLYFNPVFTAQTPYEAPGPEYRKAAEGGLMGLAVGGPVETMSAMNAVGSNLMYPQAQLQTALYSNPTMQRPEPVNVISPSGDAAVGAYTGEQKLADGGQINLQGTLNVSRDNNGQSGPASVNGYLPVGSGPSMVNQSAPLAMQPEAKPSYEEYLSSRQGGGGRMRAITHDLPMTREQYEQFNPQRISGPMRPQPFGQAAGIMRALPFAAGGGVSDLGGYSDGGRLLKGPGDGVSDSIPAVIGEKQPARLADGEFVIPARIVSELGNGSTEAGARKLYAMMDRIQKQRGKTVGKGKVAVNSKADKHLPA